MFKRLSLFLVLVPFALNAKVYYPQHIKQSDVVQAVEDGQVIMAWDIHKVLAAKEGSKYTNYALVAWKAPIEFPYAFSQLAYTKLTGRPTAASLAQKDIKALTAYNKSNSVSDASGEPYVLIFEKYGLNSIARAVEFVTSTYKPQPGIEAIVDEIAVANIPQHFASNIGPRMFEVLNNTFKTAYKSKLLEKILPGKFVDYSRWGLNPLTVLPTSLASVGKPNGKYYREFLTAYVTDKNGKKFAVFVDDSEENIKAAAQEGMIAIHFDATKPNAQAIAELRNDLTELSILK